MDTLLSTTKAAVGSVTETTDVSRGDKEDHNANGGSDSLDSLFCVCCWKAESPPSVETPAAVGSGCC